MGFRLLRMCAAGVAVLVLIFAVTWVIFMPTKAMRGVWAAPAYGQILRISGLRAELYRVTSVSCFRELTFPAHLGLVQLLAGATLKLEGGTLALRRGWRAGTHQS